MQKVQSSVTSIVPDHFCEIVTLALIGSSDSLKVVAHEHDRLESLVD